MSLAPLRGIDGLKRPWEGDTTPRPWQYKVTVAIPCVDHAHETHVIVDLYRASKVKPYFLLMDTGSSEVEHHALMGLRAHDVEVFDIRTNGVQHPSDLPAFAMDLAFSRCPTPFLFATHNDCFPVRRDLLSWYLEIMDKGFSCVGYQMSPRSVQGWQGLPSHTATLYRMSTMDSIGAGWSLRRWNTLYGKLTRRDDAVAVGWPDTEVLIGTLMKSAGVNFYKVGDETNHARHLDGNVDHCRSLASSGLYAAEYFKQATEWCAAALAAADDRLKAWRQVVDFLPPRR
jgi:hypothetical protein